MDLSIDRLVSGGDGLGFVNGKAVFVPGALPGERVGVCRTGGSSGRTRPSRPPIRGATPTGHRCATGRGAAWDTRELEATAWVVVDARPIEIRKKPHTALSQTTMEGI